MIIILILTVMILILVISILVLMTCNSSINNARTAAVQPRGESRYHILNTITVIHIYKLLNIRYSILDHITVTYVYKLLIVCIHTKHLLQYTY